MIKGRVWKFGHNVDTDQIIPSQYLLLPNVEEMKHHTFEPVDKDFSKKVVPGDIVLGGDNFGAGSSREQAPAVLKALGISAVVAQSFARIFFRNAINVGLPVIVCKEAYDQIEENDSITIDVTDGVIRCDKDGQQFTATKLPDHVMKILTANGLIEYLNKQ